MRLAYVCADFGIPIYGSKGASIHMRELSQALLELGHEVAIFSPRAGDERPYGFDVPVCELGLGRVEKTAYDLLREDPGAGVVVAKEVRALLYASSLPHHALRELRAFRPNVIYERYSLLGTAGLSIARELGVPLILEVNAPLSEEQAAHRGLTFPGLAHGLEALILRSADRVLTVSEQLRQWAIGIGVEPRRLAVQPNAVDASRFEDAEAQGAELRKTLGLDGRPVVGFLGTLKPWHGTETLLRAAARLRDRDRAPLLLIVGDGPERASLEALARLEGVPAVFTGAVPHERVPALLGAMDVAVAPYQQVDNFYFSPLKLYEYMAAARPVVAAHAGQIADTVRHGETGWLYPPGDVEALAAAIRLLLDEPDLATLIGWAGRDHVRMHHTWEGNARAVAEMVAASFGELQGVR